MGNAPISTTCGVIGVPNCADTDADGLCDDLDGCTDLTACNFADPSASECLTLDAWSGVCGGPGAVFECGCADIPAGDCDCNGNRARCHRRQRCGRMWLCRHARQRLRWRWHLGDTDDECLGELDACGVCNGPGAIYDCGCAGLKFPPETVTVMAISSTPLACVGGSCTADADADGICDDVDPCVGQPDLRRLRRVHLTGPGRHLRMWLCGHSDG